MDICEQDSTVKDYLTVPPLESHGCYNQNIMKHCRPEHDYRNPEPKRFLKVEATYVFSGKAKVPTIPSSVIPWMSQ